MVDGDKDDKGNYADKQQVTNWHTLSYNSCITMQQSMLKELGGPPEFLPFFPSSLLLQSLSLLFSAVLL